MGNRNKALIEVRMELFWQAMSETLNIKESCRIAEIDMVTYYNHKKKNPEEFEKKFEECKFSYRERLRTEVLRRACEGVEEPVFYRGEICGKIRKYSDNLLMFELKRWDAKYATERREISGAGGGPIQQKYDVVVKLERPPESVQELVQLIDEDKI